MIGAEVDRLMREIEDDVRRARRKRLLARGGAAEYRDPAIYEAVDVVLRRALEARDHDALLLPDFLSSEPDWQLTTHLRFSSHRPVIGPMLIFVKRRIAAADHPLAVRIQPRELPAAAGLNTMLFACIEELAIENAKLQGQAGRKGRRRLRQPTRRSGETRRGRRE